MGSRAPRPRRLAPTRSDYGSQLNGRLGATSQWTRFLTTKLLYGSAFKAPSPYLCMRNPCATAT